MKKKSEKLQTKRLTLRAFKECDRQQVLDIFFDEDIKKTYMIPDFESKLQAQALFEKLMNFSLSDEHFVYGICLDNVLIGFINDCETKDNTIEIGFVIAKAYHNQGFATEAVSAAINELFKMGFHKVKAGFFEENMASCRVMQKCGMHKTDLTEDIEYRGVLHHCIYYGIDK